MLAILLGFNDEAAAAVSIIGGILSATSSQQNEFNNATEHADLRHSKYLPGRADIGGIAVEPGIYTVEIRYYNLENGKVIYTQKLQNIEAKKGKFNLVSSSSTMDEFKQTDFKNNTVSSEPDNYDKLYFDLGTEPEASASRTFALFQYNWSDTYSSSIKGIYSTATETEDSYEGYGNATVVDKHKEAEVDLLPFIYNYKLQNHNQQL